MFINELLPYINHISKVAQGCYIHLSEQDLIVIQLIILNKILSYCNSVLFKVSITPSYYVVATSAQSLDLKCILSLSTMSFSSLFPSAFYLLLPSSDLYSLRLSPSLMVPLNLYTRLTALLSWQDRGTIFFLFSASCSTRSLSHLMP